MKVFHTNKKLWFTFLLLLSIDSNNAEGDDKKNESAGRESLTSRIFSFFRKKNKVEGIEEVLPTLDAYGPDQYRYYLYNYPYHVYSNGPYHQANLYTEDHYQDPTYTDHIAVYPQVEPQYSLQESHTGFQDSVHNGLHQEIQAEVQQQLYPLSFAYFNYGFDGFAKEGLVDKNEDKTDVEELSGKIPKKIDFEEPQMFATHKLNDVLPQSYDNEEEEVVEVVEETPEEVDAEDKDNRVARGFTHQFQGLPDSDPFENEAKRRSISRKDNFAFSEHLRRGYGLTVFPKYAQGTSHTHIQEAR